MGIVEFLRARLDEDEAAAKAVVIPAHDGYHSHPELSEWKVGSDGEVEYVAPVHEIPLHGGRVGVSSPHYVTMDHEGLSPSVEPDVARYIARHDPARLLREVEAKRKILDDVACGHFDRDYDEAVRHLASVYTDHPDFDPEWCA